MNYIFGIIIIIFCFSYLDKFRKKIEILNNETIYTIVETVLCAIGFFLIFDSLFGAVGLSVSNLFIKFTFGGWAKLWSEKETK